MSRVSNIDFVMLHYILYFYMLFLYFHIFILFILLHFYILYHITYYIIVHLSFCCHIIFVVFHLPIQYSSLFLEIDCKKSTLKLRVMVVNVECSPTWNYVLSAKLLSIYFDQLEFCFNLTNWQKHSDHY